MPDRPSFTCPRCGKTSYHPRDAAEWYCGACHVFVDDPAPAPEDDRATWKRLDAGIYLDRAGALHLILDELLVAYGYADTPANRAVMIQAARDVMVQLAPQTAIVVRDV